MIYVAFDVGNVLVHSDFNPFLRQLSKSLNLTLEEATYFMNRTQTLHDLGCTHMADELRDHFRDQVSCYYRGANFPLERSGNPGRLYVGVLVGSKV